MTLTAVLFTGGLSRRMGVDKATVMFGGEPLWARQLRILRELRPDALWISARARPGWCPPEAGVVLDEPPSRGPLSGLAAALKKMRTSHLLALAVDMPVMTALHLQTLSNLARPGRGVIPLNDDCIEPLCAVYPIEAAGAAADTLKRGDLSLQSLAKMLHGQSCLQTHQLNETEKFFYHNANTPADLPK